MVTHVVSYDELDARLAGHAVQGYFRPYLAQLRRKLGPEPSRPRYLLTEANNGYRFTP